MTMQTNPSAPPGFTLTLASEEATRRLAADVANVLEPGDFIALAGDLGAGKTTFVRALIAHLSGNAAIEVPSPTFTLVQTYDLPGGAVWHFDLYRLRAAEEAWELGIEEAFAEGITLIEWPERLGVLLPARRLLVKLEFGASTGTRRATLSGAGDWALRLAALAAKV
jgi:tRNA threonylcarbamoyladenosine biosynthesis protein TsaE